MGRSRGRILLIISLGSLFAVLSGAPQASWGMPGAWGEGQAVIKEAPAGETAASAQGEVSSSAGKELSLHAQSAVLMDGDSGRILYEKEGDTARPMASTTKIMTCILALERGEGSDWVEASREAAAQPEVRLGVRAGERYRLEDLLYALMLESYNDAAVMIAEHIGGSVEGFAAMMNEKARGLGCTDTYFITPNGLDAQKEDGDGNTRVHSTTAEELARIMRYCVWQSPKREEFLKITGTQNYYFTDQEGERAFNCNNHNALLRAREGMLSGKTGFTGNAGYTYVGAAGSRGRKYVIALLGCGWPPHKTYKWQDAGKLLDYGMESYDLYRVAGEESYPGIPVTGGLCWEEGENGRILGVQDGLSPEEAGFSLLLGKDEKVIRRIVLPESLRAPVAAGSPVGRVAYVLEGEELASYPLFAAEDVEEMTFQRGFFHVCGKFLDVF